MTTNKPAKKLFYASHESNGKLDVYAFPCLIACVNWIEEINKPYSYQNRIVAEKVSRKLACKFTQNHLNFNYVQLKDTFINPNNYVMFKVS